MDSNFPSNAKNPAPAAKAPEKKVEKIIEGTATRRKKPMRKRFAETFTVSNNRDVAEYMIFDEFVPQMKDMIFALLTGGLEKKFFGDVSTRARTGRGLGSVGNNRTQYHKMSANRPDPREALDRGLSKRGRANFAIDEIVLETRVEAIAIIDQLYELLSNYEVASVADLYNMVGIQPEFTDEKYGWTDLRGSDVIPLRRNEGYALDLPRPTVLD